MKEFRLFDSQWVKDHISLTIEEKERKVNYLLGPYTLKEKHMEIDYNDLFVVETYSEILAKDLIAMGRIKDLPATARIVLKDMKTKEYYWLDLHNKYLKDFYSITKIKYVAKAINECIIRAYYPINPPIMDEGPNVRVGLVEYDETPSADIIKEWLFNTLKISKDKMTDQCLQFVVDFCKTFIMPKMKREKQKLIEKAIAGEISDRELDNYIELKRSVIINLLNENKDKVFVKYTLFRNDIAFSGHYTIGFLNEKRPRNKPKTFDAISIDIGVMGGFDYTKKTIVDHKEDVLKAIWTILKADHQTRKYAKFMKLSKLKILNDGCLYCQFDFKDGLRELCEQEQLEENKVEI